MQIKSHEIWAFKCRSLPTLNTDLPAGKEGKEGGTESTKILYPTCQRMTSFTRFSSRSRSGDIRGNRTRRGPLRDGGRTRRLGDFRAWPWNLCYRSSDAARQSSAGTAWSASQWWTPPWWNPSPTRSLGSASPGTRRSRCVWSCRSSSTRSSVVRSSPEKTPSSISVAWPATAAPGREFDISETRGV